jgi:nicotinamidase-related amidase
MSKKIHLLIIDPQNDFCDIPEAEQPIVDGKRVAPALPVPGADNDMKRLSTFIERVGDKIYDIHITLDSHNPLDIAHRIWWKNSQGQNPTPFTQISVADVENGVWVASNPLTQDYSVEYVRNLEKNGRYQLMIWPEHCLIGHWGHNVHQSVMQSLDAWASKRLELVDYVTKGSNPFTEHYSAVQAEVPMGNDPSTMLNSKLIKTLSEADEIVIAGEALSHCVANTVIDIANNFGEDNIKKMVLLQDCSSSVTGFEKAGEDFVRQMIQRGMRIMDSTDYLK